jgi:LuxR family maltose regulon positive regulatory protein
LLACGEQQRAVEVGHQEKLLGTCDQMQLPKPCTTRDEMRATTWMRLAIARGDLDGAIELGQGWKRFTAKVGANKCAMRWEILLAKAYAAQHQPGRARRELRAALARAVSGGFVRSFLDEGRWVTQMLQDQLGTSAVQACATDRFIASLLQARPANEPGHAGIVAASIDVAGSAAERLTRSQIEILQMASAGLPNREIAQRVGMTEGSVKWYMQQIFNKIGIRKRAGALERARSLGLL